jgi:Tfp pilus assembly protein FimT
VTVDRHQNSSPQGYTMFELLALLLVVGIITAFAIPSLSGLYQPLRTAATSVESHLTLMRSKAMASTRAYRIRRDPATTDSAKARLIAEFSEDGGNCTKTESRWAPAPQFNLELEGTMKSTGAIFGTIPNYLCFDSRGMPNQGVINTAGTEVTWTPNSAPDFVVVDPLAANQAKSAKIKVTGMGGVSIETYTTTDATGSAIAPNDEGITVF